METELTTHGIENARERVAVGPAPEWAVMHPVDESWRVPGGAPYSLLLRDEQRHAEENATFVRQVWRLETLQAVQDAAQWKLDFDPATQRVVLHSLTVRRISSSAEHAVREKLRFLQREASLEAFVLDGWVSLLVLLEDVRVGDVLEMMLTITNEPRVFKKQCWAMAFPPSSQASRAWRWSLRFATSRPMRWKSGTATLAPAIGELPGGLTEWSWVLEHMRAEIPEPGTPDWLLPPRWIQVSDFTSWEEVASGVAASWHEDFDHPEIRRLVKEIGDQAPTREKRVDRALAMVQDDIRYLSLNIELGGAIPSPPGSVLQRRFGDCKDKSFLLAHLLRSVGVPARPVLVHTRLRSTVGSLLPTPGFNHAVIEYEMEGKRRWVDATIQLQGGGAHERFVPTFGLGLPIGPGVLALEDQPPMRKAGQYTLHERFSIDEVARQSLVVVNMRGSGCDADDLRNRMLMNGAERFGEECVEFYRHFFPGARIVGTPEWQDERKANVFQCALMLALPQTGLVSPDGRVNFFGYAAHQIRRCLPMVSGEKRTTPIRLPFGARCQHIIELANTQMSGSSDQLFNVRHGAFEFSGRCGNRPGGHVMEFSLNVVRDSVRPREMANYIARVAEVWQATSVQILMMPGPKFSVGMRKKGGLLPSARKPLPEPLVEPEPLPLEPVAAPPPANAAPTPARMGIAASLEPTAKVKASEVPLPEAPERAVAAPGTAGAEASSRAGEGGDSNYEERRSRSRDRSRGGRRKKRKGAWLKWLIGIVIALAMIGLAVWWAVWGPYR